MPADKATLRDRLREQRRALGDVSERSAALAARLADEPRWRDAVNVAAFVGVAGEPDTLAVLQAALADGKRLWLPRVVDAAGGLTELVRVDDLEALSPGAFGLREPPAGSGPSEAAVVPSMELDAVLVPGLAFDRHGGRLGHGPGHYDRLLAPVRELDRPTRIGVCFAEFLDPLADEPLPNEDHDVPMHAVVTDAELVECRTEPVVPHVIEPASSARAKCRSCGEKIDKGTLRFGERVDNPYGDGLATYWFHLVCGALRRPEAFGALLDVRPELSLDNREALAAHASRGVAHHRLPRLTKAMRDPSGRARCRHCHERIDKGLWRLSLSMWQDGRFEAMGFIHAGCAQAYFECSDVAELSARVELGSPELDHAAVAEVEAALGATAAGTDS